MRNTYSARPLTARTADMTYPLVQMKDAGMTLPKWQNFVAAYCVEGEPVNHDQWLRTKGIIVICNERGYVHGLFSYEVRSDMSAGKVLHVDNVMAIEIVARDHALNEMRAAMDRLTELHGCTAVHVAVDDMDGKMKDYFSHAGYLPRKIRYCSPAQQH